MPAFVISKESFGTSEKRQKEKRAENIIPSNQALSIKEVTISPPAFRHLPIFKGMGLIKKSPFIPLSQRGK
jgi:hypothetical protein